MRPSIKKGVVLHLISFLALSPLVSASLTPRSYPEECSRPGYPSSVADVTLIGTVTDVESSWGEEGFLITDAAIRVETVLGGDLSSGQVAVKHVGGSVDGFSLSVSGEPAFERGERVRVHLSVLGDQTYSVACGAHGVQDLGTSDQDFLSIEENLNLAIGLAVVALGTGIFIGLAGRAGTEKR